MPAGSLKELRETLARLQNGHAPEAAGAVSEVPWSERRQLPAVAASIIEAKPSAAQVAVAGEIIALLAGDSKWEVRKAVADALRSVPDESFAPVLARLTSDETSFVRLAAETAIERRSKGTVTSGRRRPRPAIGERLAEIERRFGPEAARLVRQIGEAYYDELVGATAHDVRNIIAPLPSQVAKLSNQADAGTITSGRARQILRRIRERVVLLDRLISAMREYASPVTADRRSERVQRLMEEAVGLATDALEDSEFDVDKLLVELEAPPSATMPVARESFLMALVNVVKNAMEAALGHADTEALVELTAVLDADEVRITVRDNGAGLDGDDLAELRQFLPRRKSKKRNGTGFGLPRAQRTISEHGGLLEIESEPGVGTLVTIRIPWEPIEEPANGRPAE